MPSIAKFWPVRADRAALLGTPTARAGTPPADVQSACATDHWPTMRRHLLPPDLAADTEHALTPSPEPALDRGASVARSSEPGPGLPPQGQLAALQRRAVNKAVNELLARSSGEPLEPDVRRRAERKLGADLGAARVHSGDSASEVAAGLRAEAVTVGHDVYLGRPLDAGTKADEQTLVHELAHVAQKESGAPSQPVARISGRQDAAEQEASRVAAGGLDGGPARLSQPAAAVTAHRKLPDEEQLAEDADVAGPAPIPDLLNPEPLGRDEETSPATGAGQFGEHEAVAFEVRVLGPLRRALAAVEQQDWDVALERLAEPGLALLEYESAYEKRDPARAAEMRGIRGWIGQAVAHMRYREGARGASDQAIANLVSDGIADLETLAARLG